MSIHIMKLTIRYWLTQAVSAAVKLQMQPETTVDQKQLTHLYRNLSMLGLFCKQSESYILSDMGAYLKSPAVITFVQEFLNNEQWEKIIKLGRNNDWDGGVQLLETKDVLPGIPNALRELLLGYRYSKSLNLFARYKMADVLSESKMNARELSDRLGIPYEIIAVILESLLEKNILIKNDGRYLLSDHGRLLISTHQEMWHYFVLSENEGKWRAAGLLMQTIKTGEQAFLLANGIAMYQYLETNEEEKLNFDQAMTAITTYENREILGKLDIGTAMVIMDCGGGHGQLLECLLNKYLHTIGVLFEMQSTLDGIKSTHPLRSKYANRFILAPGDFFVPATIPQRNDLIILKRVLHNWADEPAAQLLRNLMSKGERVCILEHVFSESQTPDFTVACDLLLWACFGSGLRNQEDFQALLTKAGYQNISVQEVGGMLAINAAAPIPQLSHNPCAANP